MEDVAGAIVPFTNFGPAAPDVLQQMLLDAWTGGRGLRDHEQAELQHWLILWQLHNARVLLGKGAVRKAEQTIDRTSSLYRLLSGVLMLLTYPDRRSGRAHTIAVGYFVWEADALIAFSWARWWTNPCDGEPVMLLLRGRRVETVPTVIHEREVIIRTLEEFIARVSIATARRLPFGLPTDREPTQVDLQTIQPGCCFIRLQIVRRPRPRLGQARHRRD